MPARLSLSTYSSLPPFEFREIKLLFNLQRDIPLFARAITSPHPKKCRHAKKLLTSAIIENKETGTRNKRRKSPSVVA
jgi:hypothetical protein